MKPASRHFRAGVGTVIYNQAGQIIVWQRHAPPVGTWQLQQGGIDAGELPEETLWRELQEETGLTKTAFLRVDEFPDWTLYIIPEFLAERDHDWIGQAHRWFFLELKPNTTIDLSIAEHDEFSDWRLTTFPELIAETSPLKRTVYEQLATYFEAHILK